MIGIILMMMKTSKNKKKVCKNNDDDKQPSGKKVKGIKVDQLQVWANRFKQKLANDLFLSFSLI